VVDTCSCYDEGGFGFAGGWEWGRDSFKYCGMWRGSNNVCMRDVVGTGKVSARYCGDVVGMGKLWEWGGMGRSVTVQEPNLEEAITLDL